MSSTINTENISRLWSSIIIDQLAKNGLSHYYCAPGMRNAPLLSAIKKCDKNIYSFFDERSLAFRALGASKNDVVPVLTCTSGTAMANFLPAVIEAYRSNLPMIVISADRPIELVKSDANQTIDQKGIYGSYVCESLHLDAPSESLSPKRLRSLIQNVVNKALRLRRPVHINLPLREPLHSKNEFISPEYIEKALKSDNQMNLYHNSQSFKVDDTIERMLLEAKSPIIVVGKIDNNIDHINLAKILKKINVPKYLDVTSKIKYLYTLEDNIIPSFDHPEVYEAYTKNSPDLIIHIGGRLVSKHYYRFQEENEDIKILHITKYDNHHDPGFSNNDKLICEPGDFIKYLNTLGLSFTSPIDWTNFINKKRDVIEDSRLCAAKVSKKVIENSSENTRLLIGNSTAIRSFDNFIHPTHSYPLKTYHNRGVSGIEGFIATLSGIIDSDKVTSESDIDYTLVLGDISFKYDLNSLYMLNEHRDKNIKVIILNDFGGGIFNLLPIADDSDYIDLLTTPHQDTFEKLVAAFSQINYIKIDNESDFEDTIQKRLTGINIIELMIEKKNNLEVFQKLKTIKL